MSDQIERKRSNITKRQRKLYNAIKEIAQKVIDLNMVYTRSDLAFELYNHDIQVDSIDVGDAVWNAYKFFNKPKLLNEAFITNDLTDSLLSSYIARDMAEGDFETHTTDFLDKNSEDLKRNQSFLEVASKDFSHRVSALPTRARNQSADKVSNFLQNATEVVTATKGVRDVSYQAEALFSAVNEVNNAYKSAIASVRNSIDYFALQREHLLKIYYYYSSVLLDLYGDRIRVVEPELFDYNRIEFLDVDAILEGLSTDIFMLQDECTELSSQFMDNTMQIAESTGQFAKDSRNVKASLIYGGGQLLMHQLSAHQQTAQVKSEFERIKRKAITAVAEMQGDSGRLFQIFKVINDLHISRALAFNRYADKVLTEEINGLLSVIYGSDEMIKLQQERESLINMLQDINRKMEDAELHVALYEGRVKGYDDFLNGGRAHYEEILASLPKKPSTLQRVLTMDRVADKYNEVLRLYYEDGSVDFLNDYISTQYEKQLDETELEHHRNLITEFQQKREELNKKLTQLSLEASKMIYTDKELSAKFGKHLVSIVGLLKGARNIINSGIEESLQRPVVVSDYSELFEVPMESREALEKLASKLHTFADERVSVSSSVMGVSAVDIAHSAVDMLKEYTMLELEKEQTAMAAEAYQAERARLKAKFQQACSEIDDKSSVILETLKIINTTDNREVMIKGLAFLADVDLDDFSQEDIDDFLLGKKVIEL